MGVSIYEEMLKIMHSRYPNYADVWEETKKEFGDTWVTEFNFSVDRLFGSKPEAWNEALDGYAEFCTDALRSQIYFERRGEYKASSYAEVAESCYHNEDFMMRCYLPGMFLSHFIWPHHHRMLRYFRSLLPYYKDVTDAQSHTEPGCRVD